MSEIIVSLNIGPDEYLKLYQGVARSVFTQTREGRSIRFPANILQPFVGHEGVVGSFKIEFDKENRFKSISRLA
jgi:hypothetical protein